MHKQKNSFSRSMSLKGKKSITLLFRYGYVRQIGSIRFYCLPLTSSPTNQVLIAVPKKRVKKAVKRNKIKRQIREAYRTLRKNINTKKKSAYMLGYVYTGGKENMPSYAQVASAISKSFSYLGRF